MSANWDRNQGFRFYYGNAARDLADALPPEEPSFVSSQEHFLEEAHALLDLTEQHIQKLFKNQEELSFLIQDLKRIVR